MLPLYGGGLFGGGLYGGAVYAAGVGPPPAGGWQAAGPARVWAAAGPPRVWQAGGNDVGQLVRNIVTKAPGDAVVLYCDFGECPQLAEGGAVISSCLIVEVTTSALTLTGKASDDYRAWAKVSGGVDGTDYLVKFTATLDTGEVVERTCTLQVRV